MKPTTPTTPEQEWQMAMQAAPARLAYRLTEGAKLIGVSRTQGYKLMASGELRTFKSGKARLVTHEALMDYLQKAEGKKRKAA